MYPQDEFVKLLNDLPDWFVEKVVSFGQSSKITAGNEQEVIIEKLFNNLGVPGISATCGDAIDNTTRVKKSHVDVGVFYNNRPIIAIDVKNGGANGTESAGSRANDVEARVEGAAQKGYEYYVYLFTPQSACNTLDHVDIAMKRLATSTISCKLITASLKENDPNLQVLCNVITQHTGVSVDTTMVMNVYNKLNVQPSLKDRIKSKSEKVYRTALEREEKKITRSGKKASRNR